MRHLNSLYHWLSLSEQHLKKAFLINVLGEFCRLSLLLIIALFISGLLDPTPFQAIKMATLTVLYLTLSALTAILNHFSDQLWQDITHDIIPRAQTSISNAIADSQKSWVDSLQSEISPAVINAEKNLHLFFKTTFSQLINNGFGLLFMALCLLITHNQLAMIILPLILIPPLFMLLSPSLTWVKKETPTHWTRYLTHPFMPKTTPPPFAKTIDQPKPNHQLSHLVTHALGILILFLVGSHEYTASKITLFNLFMLLLFIPELSRLSIQLTENGLMLQKTSTSIRTLFVKLDALKKSHSDNQGTFAFNPLDPIILNGIYFNFPHHKAILQDIHMHFGAHSVAIEGHEKSGKTTLLKIITQWYNDATGDIQIGNHPAQDINLHLMHDKISWADATDDMTHISIYALITQNISCHQSEIDQALNLAHCGFIHHLSEKQETPVNQLSYDQRQKLKLARMILKKPILWVFDDITAKTNYQTTLEIWETIQCLMESHRVIYASPYIPKHLHFHTHYILNKTKLSKIGC
ncbi:ABC transporter ATP-binding protein/permease [Gammaproteobacteria bacterium]|nr:ABC transporter ATP-binding protein/permease [Gammaproteobacteria bacterium]